MTGTVILTGSSVLGRLLAFLTIPLLTRALGPAPFGEAAIVATVTALATILAMSGIDLSYARFGLQGAQAEQAQVERFIWRWALTASVVLGSLVGAGWWVTRSGDTAGALGVAAYLLIMTVTSVALGLSMTRQRLQGRYRRIGVATLAGAVTSAAISIGVAELWRQDVWALLTGLLGGALVSVMVLGWPSPSALLQSSALDGPRKKAILTLGLSSLVTAPVYWIITSVDRWFILHNNGAETVGIYALAVQVATLGLMLNSALTLTWFPEVSRAYGDGDGAPGVLVGIGKNGARLLAGLMIIWVAISVSGGDVYRLVTTDSFHSGIRYIPWLAAGTMFYGISTFFVTGLFLAGRMRFVALCWMLGGVATLAAYAVLVPLMGAFGAAIAQPGVFALIAVSIAVFSHRTLPIPLPLWRLTAAGVIALVAVWALSSPVNANPLFSLALKFVPGLVVAGVIIVIVDSDAVRAGLISLVRRARGG